MRSIRIERDGDKQRVDYELRSDGWYVRPAWESEFKRFAVAEARSVDVRQLIRKEYGQRY